MCAVPSTIQGSLLNTNRDLFPNIIVLLKLLGVLPVIICEIERCVSSLRRLQNYIRSTMGQTRVTGLALMHVHQHITVDINAIIDDFALLQSQRMKLANVLSDCRLSPSFLFVSKVVDFVEDFNLILCFASLLRILHFILIGVMRYYAI